MNNIGAQFVVAKRETRADRGKTYSVRVFM